jgi:predicted DNA-binding transcriptional regulator AlpA
MRDGGALPGWPLLLRRELAASYLGMSPSTFDAAVKDGLMPRPVPLVASVKAWHRADLEAWAEDRRAAADCANSPDANPWDNAA